MSEPVPAANVRLVSLPRHAGLRVDQFLAATTRLSRRHLRRLLAAGQVRRNGQVVRVQSRLLQAGDVLELACAPEQAGITPASPRFTVIHQDAWLLVVDKAAGVLSQPAERQAADELALDEQVLEALALAGGGPPFVRLIHRLDRATSGLTLFALRPEALAPLAAAWRENRVERRYLALVEGRPQPARQRIEAAIARDPGASWRFAVSDHGRPAGTELEVVRAGEVCSLVACRLLTGRTHQVRVHLAHAGHPVLGDRLYGSRQAAPRPLLHAAALVLPHPEDGHELRLEAPLPADFAPFLTQLATP